MQTWKISSSSWRVWLREEDLGVPGWIWFRLLHRSGRGLLLVPSPSSDCDEDAGGSETLVVSLAVFLNYIRDFPSPLSSLFSWRVAKGGQTQSGGGEEER
jgi:hypothetical protein